MTLGLDADQIAALDLLGLQAGAADDAVRSAYRNLAMACHPDQGAPGEEPIRTRAMAELNRAFTVLRTRGTGQPAPPPPLSPRPTVAPGPPIPFTVSPVLRPWWFEAIADLVEADPPLFVDSRRAVVNLAIWPPRPGLASEVHEGFARGRWVLAPGHDLLAVGDPIPVELDQFRARFAPATLSVHAFFADLVAVLEQRVPEGRFRDRMNGVAPLVTRDFVARVRDIGR